MRSLVLDVLAEPLRSSRTTASSSARRSSCPGTATASSSRWRARSWPPPSARSAPMRSPGSSSSAGGSWRAPPSSPTWCRRPSCSSRSTRRSRTLGLAEQPLGARSRRYPSFTVPFVTWLLMGYFESIPEELEESAMIDGATRFGAFYRIVLPLAAPGVLAASLYAFTQAWNEFLYSLVFITDGRLRTLPGGPRQLHHRATCTAGATSWRARCSPRCRSSPPTCTSRSTWWRGSPRAASRASRARRRG